MKCFTIEQYINEYIGTYPGAKGDFAKSIGITPSKLSRWISDEFKVIVDTEFRSECHEDLPNMEVSVVSNRFNLPITNKCFFIPFNEDVINFPLLIVHEYENFQDSYICLNLVNGEITAEIKQDDIQQQQLRNKSTLFFYINSLLTNRQINLLVEECTPYLQRLMALSKLEVTQGNYEAIAINDEFDFEKIIEETTRKIDEYVNNIPTDNVIYTEAQIEPELFINGDIKKEIKSYIKEKNIIFANGIDEEFIYKKTLSYLLNIFEEETMIEDDTSLSKDQITDILNAVKQGILETDFIEDLMKH